MTKSHIFESELTLPVSRDAAFAFFSDTHNLERITPPELRFHILTPSPIVLKEGALIDYSLQLFGVGFRWRTKISRWDPPHSFTDDQEKGPYASWVHTHFFEGRGPETLMRDVVHYELPFFPLGEAGHFLVRRQVERIFAYRREVLLSLFPA